MTIFITNSLLHFELGTLQTTIFKLNVKTVKNKVKNVIKIQKT